MIEIRNHEVVVIHDIDYGDYSRVLEQIEYLELPFAVTSLTDLVDEENRYNRGSRAIDAIANVDRLVIQDSLMNPMTSLVRRAIAVTFPRSDSAIDYGIFDKDYKYRSLEHEIVS